VWIHRQWLLAWVKNFLAGQTQDPHNLICNCKLRSVDPQHITMDELKTEFFVCIQNIKLHTKNGPAFCLKFLKGLVAAAKGCSRSCRSTKISGIIQIQKEASQKQWRQINTSTKKTRANLTVLVKVPPVNGRHTKFETKEGVFPCRQHYFS
jgi:hypothetical protein